MALLACMNRCVTNHLCRDVSRPWCGPVILSGMDVTGMVAPPPELAGPKCKWNFRAEG